VNKNVFCVQGVSAAIIFVAAWVIKKYGDITKITTDTYTLVPCGILVGIGVLIFITALFGCCGTCRDNKCCLSTVSIYNVSFTSLRNPNANFTKL